MYPVIEIVRAHVGISPMLRQMIPPTPNNVPMKEAMAADSITEKFTSIWFGFNISPFLL